MKSLLLFAQNLRAKFVKPAPSREEEVVLYVIGTFDVLQQSTAGVNEDGKGDAMIYAYRETALFLRRGLDEGRSGYDIMKSAIAFTEAEAKKFRALPPTDYNQRVAYCFIHDAKVYLDSYFTEKNFPDITAH